MVLEKESQDLHRTPFGLIWLDLILPSLHMLSRYCIALMGIFVGTTLFVCPGYPPCLAGIGVGDKWPFVNKNDGTKGISEDVHCQVLG